MKFSRSDYNGRIIDTEGRIPNDEPVFLLRSTDSLAPRLLLMWAMELRLQGGDPKLAEEAESHAQDMIDWQKSHKVKLPNIQRDSDQKRWILVKIQELLKSIEKGESVNIKDIQDWVGRYYGSDDLVMILMPMDLKTESRVKDTESLTFDDFNLDDEEILRAFDCKLILYKSQTKTKILKNLIYES